MKKKKVTREYKFRAIIDEHHQGYESFTGTINFLIETALKQNVILNNQDIANALKITAAQFNSYMQSDRAPKEVFSLLRSVYYDYLLNYEVVNIEFHVQLPDPLDDLEGQKGE